MWEYNYSNELYHHGVPGMKWGKRKNYNADGSLNSRGQARQDYKTAKKNQRSAAKAYSKANHGFGIKALDRANKAESKYYKSEMNTINAKAKYNASKSKNSEKAELKTYTKEMYKSGLSGSAKDRASGGRSTRLYNNMKAKKGKAYADKVQKKVQNQAIATIAASAAVSVGSIVVGTMLQYRD